MLPFDNASLRRYLSNQACREEAAYFEAYLISNKETSLDELVDNELARAEDYSSLPPIDIELALSKVYTKLALRKSSKSNKSTEGLNKKIKRFPTYGESMIIKKKPKAKFISFAIIGCLSLIGIYYLKFPRLATVLGGTGSEIYQNIAYTTTGGQQMELQLPDGSHVWLGPNGRLEYDPQFGSSHRKLRLSGEAYFEVVKKVNSIFQLSTGAVEVSVLGTSFKVTAHPEDENISVSVATGLVYLSESHTDFHSKAIKEILIDAGKAVDFNKKSHLTKYRNFSLAGTQSLVKNALYLQESSFNDFAKILSRYYGIQVHLPNNNNNNNCKISGYFINQDLFKVLKSINYHTPFKYEYNNKNLSIFPIGC